MSGVMGRNPAHDEAGGVTPKAGAISWAAGWAPGSPRAARLLMSVRGQHLIAPPAKANYTPEPILGQSRLQERLSDPKNKKK